MEGAQWNNREGGTKGESVCEMQGAKAIYARLQLLVAHAHLAYFLSSAREGGVVTVFIPSLHTFPNI